MVRRVHRRPTLRPVRMAFPARMARPRPCPEPAARASGPSARRARILMGLQVRKDFPARLVAVAVEAGAPTNARTVWPVPRAVAEVPAAVGGRVATQARGAGAASL